jgi:hypothetical protein
VATKVVLDAMTKKKISPLRLTGIEPRSSNPYPSHYTDCATPAATDLKVEWNFFLSMKTGFNEI